MANNLPMYCVSWTPPEGGIKRFKFITAESKGQAKRLAIQRFDAYCPEIEASSEDMSYH